MTIKRTDSALKILMETAPFKMDDTMRTNSSFSPPLLSMSYLRNFYHCK